MAGFSGAVQWWGEQQMRILVLASLLIQWFLFITAPLRKRGIPALLRFFIWLAYLSSDAVAIYALATLFNRQKQESQNTNDDESDSGLQVLWAPILLVHLGGQEAITAYNIEDNELWRRHALTAVSQVTVAVYVFVKYYTWPSKDTPGIVEAALLLFVYGITKCIVKPWDLKRVSINSLADSSSSGEKGEINSLDEYVRAATQYFQAAGHGSLQTSGADDITKVDQVWEPYNLCVDLAPLYSDRLSCLKHMVHNQDEAHRLVQSGLSVTFTRLYTKEALKQHDTADAARWTTITVTKRLKFLTSSTGLRMLTAGCLLWATVKFATNIGKHKTRRDENTSQQDDIEYNKADIIITYALIFCALVMDFVAPGVIDSRDRLKRWWFNEGRWPDQVAQYNLIGYLARNKKHSWLMKMATCLVGVDLIDQWCVKSSKSSHEITKLVHGHIARGWMEGHMADAEAFREFNDSRGQWTLGKEDAHTSDTTSSRGSLRSSVSRPFDESVLLWHLTTDFCFRHLHHTEQTPSYEDAAHRCREMSNYMAYLLFVNPEMLMPGARRSLFRAAYKELAGMLKENPHTPRGQTETGLALKVIELVKSNTQGPSVVHQAWRMAEGLMESHRGDEQRMWGLIQGVWVEMLCFSAGRCRGYLHAKNLSTGGEYLSYVWLLLLYMGMETLAEKMQRTELYDDRTATAATAINDLIV